MTYEHNYAITEREQIEREVLGRMLIDASAIPAALFHCAEDDFANAVHRAAFAALGRLQKANSPDCGVVSATKEMRRLDPTLAFGATAAVLGLAQNSCPTGANIEHFSRALVDLVERERVAIAARNLMNQPNEASIEAVEEAIRELSSARRDVPESVSDVMHRRFDEIAAESEGEAITKRAPTGLAAFDEFGGMWAGELWVLGARPSMGKSILGLQIAEHCARRGGRTLVNSLEMQKGELADRLSARDTGIPFGRLRMGKISPDEWGDLDRVSRSYEQVPLEFIDKPRLSITELVATAERAARKSPLSLVVVDYLQLVSSGAARVDTREQEVAKVSRELKQLAKSLEAPVLALAQLNRGLESRQDKRPTLGDLRDSGAIEQDADVVMFLYRDKVYNEDADPRAAELIVGKHRNMRPGTIALDFDGPAFRFIDPERGGQ